MWSKATSQPKLCFGLGLLWVYFVIRDAGEMCLPCGWKGEGVVREIVGVLSVCNGGNPETWLERGSGGTSSFTRFLLRVVNALMEGKVIVLGLGV